MIVTDNIRYLPKKLALYTILLPNVENTYRNMGLKRKLEAFLSVLETCINNKI